MDMGSIISDCFCPRETEIGSFCKNYDGSIIPIDNLFHNNKDYGTGEAPLLYETGVLSHIFHRELAFRRSCWIRTLTPWMH